MDHLLAVIAGVPLTLLVAVVSFVIGVALAVPLTALQLAPWAPTRIASRALVELIRGLPPIVWLFIIYFGVKIGTFQFDALSASFLGLGIVSAAYLSEIFRTGVLSLQAGQWEASAALGVTGVDTVARVVAPQAIRVAVPAATGYAISLIKDAAVVSAIGVADIAFVTTQDARSNAGGLTVYLIAAGVYLLLCLPVAAASRYAGEVMQRKVSR